MTVLRIPRTSQPQSAGGSRIDWANPAYPDVYLLTPSFGKRNLISGADGSDFAGGLSVSAGKVGVSVSAFGQTLTVGGKGLNTGITELPSKLTCIVQFDSVDGPFSGLAYGSPYHKDQYAVNWHHNSPTYRGSVSLHVGASYPVVSLLDTSSQKVHTVVFTWDGSILKVWQNGVYCGSSTASGTLNTGSSDPLSIGCNSGATKFAFNGNVYLASLKRSSVPDALAKSLSSNPWQIFAPLQRPIYVSEVAGGGTYTLTAEAASYTLAGADSATTYNRICPADAGSYALTGAAATLAYSPAGGPTYTLVSDAAAFSLAANANLAFNRALSAAQGTFNLTGDAATLARGYTLAANASSYALSGSDAALIATRKLIAEAYAAVLAGADAGLTYTPLALPTIGRPASDTSNSGWTASTGVNLYAMVDEVVPDALDYITTTAVGSVCELALDTTAYPGTASQALKYRASSSTGNSLIVRLKNGATTIRTETQALTATDTEYTVTLTSGEIAAITSGALSVELESA